MDPLSTALLRLARKKGKKPDAKSRWKAGGAAAVLKNRFGALARVHPAADAPESNETSTVNADIIKEQVKFQHNQDALREWYIENDVDRSFEQANEQLNSMLLTSEHLEAAMDNYENVTGGPTVINRSVARIVPYLAKTCSVLNIIAMIFALIPPVYENDAFDPLFYTLAALQIVPLLLVNVIGTYGECASRFPETAEDCNGDVCDAGCKTKVLSREYVETVESAAAGKLIGNFIVMRMFMLVRLASVTFAFTLKCIAFYNYETGGTSPGWFFPAGLALLTFTVGENVASYMGYGPYCPSYSIGIWLLQAYYGCSNIPFRPVEKAMFRFASMVLVAFIVPGYIITIVHNSLGVKSTASFVVPQMASLLGIGNLLMISCVKT